MILDPIIEPVFPTATLHSHINREFTDAEVAYFNAVSADTIKNEFNVTSRENYVLDAPEMSVLREEIQSFVQSWFDKVACNSKVQPYITQSWLNYTMKGQRHHIHTHPNSYLSGVLYIAGDEDDRINFDKGFHEAIRIVPEQENQYNSDVTWFKVPRGKLILFPSHVRHMVDTKKTDNIRISMAFNTFLRGHIGKNSSLTELKL